jgi:hypothetical protein
MFQSKAKKVTIEKDRIAIIKLTILNNERIIQINYLRKQIRNFLEDARIVKTYIKDNPHVCGDIMTEEYLDNFLNHVRTVSFGEKINM